MKTVALLLLALLTCASTFTVAPLRTTTAVSSSSSLKMTLLTYGSKKKDFRPGSPLKNACSALGVKPRYNCKKGECNSCVLTVGGSRMKPCVDKVPPEPKLKSLQEKGLAIR